MSRYGYIKVTNLSLSDELFCKVCDVLRLITSHCHQNERTFFIYGINNNEPHFNVDRGAITKQSVRFLDSVAFYLRRFPQKVINGLTYEYAENP